jgi:hypothetical protein
VPFDPVPVVVARAGISDHLPAGHIAIPAVYGVSEKSLLGILQQLFEECPPARTFKLNFALLQPGEQFVLVAIGNLGE